MATTAERERLRRHLRMYDSAVFCGPHDYDAMCQLCGARSNAYDGFCSPRCLFIVLDATEPEITIGSLPNAERPDPVQCHLCPAQAVWAMKIRFVGKSCCGLSDTSVGLYCDACMPRPKPMPHWWPVGAGDVC